jgi:nitroreductase
VINGARMQAFLQHMASQEIREQPAYEIYPRELPSPYRDSRFKVGEDMYGLLGIPREDKAARFAHLARNFEFFGAPYIAFIGMDQKFGTTVAIDVGMWAQTLMLTMVAFGLHSCPMGTMRNYPDMVREAFGIEDGTKILFGISFGYEDQTVAANATRTTRDPTSANVVIKSS